MCRKQKIFVVIDTQPALCACTRSERDLHAVQDVKDIAWA